MHPDFAYQIASYRRDELTGEANRRRTAAHRRRQPFWRRRRKTPPDAIPALKLVGPPPPRLGRDPTGRDERVA